MKKRRKIKRRRKTSTVPKGNLTNPLEGIANGERIALDILGRPESKEVIETFMSWQHNINVMYQITVKTTSRQLTRLSVFLKASCLNSLQPYSDKAT